MPAGEAPPLGHGHCDGKRRHATREEATAVITEMLRQPDADRPGLVRAYVCRFCGGWHLGHRRQPGDERREKEQLAFIRARCWTFGFVTLPPDGRVAFFAGNSLTSGTEMDDLKPGTRVMVELFEHERGLRASRLRLAPQEG